MNPKPKTPWTDRTHHYIRLLCSYDAGIWNRLRWQPSRGRNWRYDITEKQASERAISLTQNAHTVSTTPHMLIMQVTHPGDPDVCQAIHDISKRINPPSKIAFLSLARYSGFRASFKFQELWCALHVNAQPRSYFHQLVGRIRWMPTPTAG